MNVLTQQFDYMTGFTVLSSWMSCSFCFLATVGVPDWSKVFQLKFSGWFPFYYVFFFLLKKRQIFLILTSWGSVSPNSFQNQNFVDVIHSSIHSPRAWCHSVTNLWHKFWPLKKIVSHVLTWKLVVCHVVACTTVQADNHFPRQCRFKWSKLVSWLYHLISSGSRTINIFLISF